MKSLFKVLITSVCLVFAGNGLAQDTPATYGFLNLINLVPGQNPCKINLTGKDVVPGGLAAAQSTGWFIVPTGNMSLSLEIEGFERGAGNVDITDAQSSLFVIFLEPNRQLGPDGKPLHPKIKMKRCDPLEKKSGFYLKAMSFVPEENRFIIGPQSINLKFLEAADVPKWGGGGFKITNNQQPVGESLPVTEKGSFYLFLGTDHVGKYCSVLVRAEKQDLPPWMKQKTAKP